MAKVNFNFQDELGSNLNRYLAKDVTSGIEYTFDLNRKATITKNGTPLNASNLNQLVNAINENVDEISNIKKSIPTFEYIDILSGATWGSLLLPKDYKILMVEVWGNDNFTTIVTLPILPSASQIIFSGSYIVNNETLFSADVLTLTYNNVSKQVDFRIESMGNGNNGKLIWAYGLGNVWGLAYN